MAEIWWLTKPGREKIVAGVTVGLEAKDMEVPIAEAVTAEIEMAATAGTSVGS
jgi:hypothetical protein